MTERPALLAFDAVVLSRLFVYGPSADLCDRQATRFERAVVDAVRP